ncbi:MAG: prolyl oligopeptidase family serine peptidase [Elusimicrobiota bacterium]|nr:prolyl oligopeptidase family serine peptidase [Elusimicrobiota bacterium]
MSDQRPYTEWRPAVSPEQVFSDVLGLNEIHTDGRDVYWIEMRPSEGGRYVIVRADKNGKISDVTPRGFNARTRVHEYGGGSYAVYGDMIYFVNFKDQRIYKQHVNSPLPVAVTPAKNSDGSLGKYASLTFAPGGKRLLFVYEKEYEDRENKNFIGVLDLSREGSSEPAIIAEGSDFYADCVFSQDGDKIAWLQWDHPNMPWDSTELMLGTFQNGSLHEIKKIDGGKGKSVCFPKFGKKNALYYIMDKKGGDPGNFENWWNIYRYSGEIQRITSELAEFGEPHWVFGQSGYDFLSDGRIAARMLKDEKEYLVIINPEDKTVVPVKKDLASCRCVNTGKDSTVFFIGSGSAEKTSVCSLDINSGSDSLNIIRKSSEFEMEERDISVPEIIDYTTGDGKKAHAFFYSPENSRYIAPAGDKPPLLVMAHGGPTSRTDSSFSAVLQFWTSAGFAVADVNYRGSTGYGRKYRDELLSHWGLKDTSDVADAVKYLIKEKKINPSMVAIRGGSAGGYMVQRVMTEYPQLIKAGASYYGIGNLVTLREGTHKFESRYIDNLVGEIFTAGKEVYKERSPVNHLDKLISPMIIFQGSDDKIVTPDCSREVASLLKDRGISYEYVEYEGEAHGFRSKKSNVDSLSKEFAFYRRIFSGGQSAD